MKVKKCLMEKGECKDVCKACVEDKCVGEVGKAKAECAMANCQQDCKCKKCLMEKGECKDVCKACVEDKCAGEVGKAKAECAMANCQQDCKCKRKCLLACTNKE